MRRLRSVTHLAPAAAALALLVAIPMALAQTPPLYSGAPGAPPLTTPILPQATEPQDMSVPKDTTPPQPGAAQPTLPGAPRSTPPKPTWPIVEQIVGPRRTALTVRKEAALPPARRRHLARQGSPRAPLDRPALAGVELLAPLPPPGEPPHIVVPTPAFPLESFVAAVTIPPPPIVCHATRRDPDAPDPHLYREVPVDCEPDNP